MTGRHAYPYADFARAIDELYMRTPATAAPLPPRRSPAGVDRGRVGAEVSPNPQHQLGDTSTNSTPTADLMQPAGEGAGPHSLIRRLAPEPFARQVDAYDDSIDVDDTLQDIVTGIRAPRAVTSHTSIQRSR